MKVGKATKCNTKKGKDTAEATRMRERKTKRLKDRVKAADRIKREEKQKEE